MAQRCYLLGDDPQAFLGQEIDGFPVTPEMVNAVQIYLDAIAAKYDELPGDNKTVHLEIRLVHPDYPEFGGTIDCLITSSVAFRIVDFKYGAGVVVDVNCNEQLSCYGALALANGDYISDCQLTVVQPRAHHDDGPVRSWICDLPYLVAFMRRVKEVMDGKRSGELKAGDHCQWCPAKVNCPVLRDLTLEMAKKEFKEEEIMPEHAGNVLDAGKSIKLYLEAVHTWAHGQLDKGVRIPGYKLVKMQSMRRYKVDEDYVLRRCRSKGFGKLKIYDTKLKSPAQLEKVVGANLVAELVEKPDKGTTIAPVTDPRKAVERESASEEFANE